MAEINNRIKPNVKLAPPPMFKVIYINDNQTSMEFVIDSLIQYFEYNAVTAVKITTDIHDAGSACVAVLQIKLEPDAV